MMLETQPGPAPTRREPARHPRIIPQRLVVEEAIRQGRAVPARVGVLPVDEPVPQPPRRRIMDERYLPTHMLPRLHWQLLSQAQARPRRQRLAIKCKPLSRTLANSTRIHCHVPPPRTLGSSAPPGQRTGGRPLPPTEARHDHGVDPGELNGRRAVEEAVEPDGADAPVGTARSCRAAPASAECAAAAVPARPSFPQPPVEVEKDTLCLPGVPAGAPSGRRPVSPTLRALRSTPKKRSEAYSSSPSTRRL